MVKEKRNTHLIMKMKEYIIRNYDPEAIILFGSQGRGEADEYSDIDLLIIFDRDNNKEEIAANISSSLDHITKGKDIIVRSLNDYYLQCDIPGTIVFSAIKEGMFLFKKEDFDKNVPNTKSYEKRKMDVIKKEYIEQAHYFLDKAESSLEKGNFFRCRDFLKFATVRTIKSLFVKENIHPPREADLNFLLRTAIDLNPDFEEYSDFLKELNGYSPEANGDNERRISRKILEKTSFFVKDIKNMLLKE